MVVPADLLRQAVSRVPTTRGPHQYDAGSPVVYRIDAMPGANDG
jgi:hypothetical protein